MQDLFSSSSCSCCIWVSETQPPQSSFERNDPCSPYLPPLQAMLPIQCMPFGFPQRCVPHVEYNRYAVQQHLCIFSSCGPEVLTHSRTWDFLPQSRCLKSLFMWRTHRSSVVPVSSTCFQHPCKFQGSVTRHTLRAAILFSQPRHFCSPKKLQRASAHSFGSTDSLDFSAVVPTL